MREKLFIALITSFGLVNLAQAAPHGMYLTRDARELNKILNSKPAPKAKKKLLYYGGPVISSARVYSVFWGPNVDQITQKQIGGFFSAAINSTHMDWLKEYNTSIKAVDGRDGTHQTIGRGTYAGEILITPAHTGRTIDDTEIQAELDQQVDAGVLPKPDPNTLYMIYFPPGITIKIEGSASCSSFCAYHEGFISKKHGNIFYGVMPDLGGACSFGCGMSGDRFDDVTAVSSHELIEAITDPFPTPGDKPAYPQAWNTYDGNEIADICAGQTTRLTTQGLTYVLSREFDNATSSCAAGPYQSP